MSLETTLLSEATTPLTRAAPKAAWLKQFGVADDWQMAGLPYALHLDGSAACKSKALEWG